MRVFWWNTVPNVGDVLTQMLLEARGVGVDWSPPSDAEFVGIGSVLEWFDGSEVTVWGSGRAGKKAQLTDLRRANVLALRGMLTRELVTGASTVPLGDPGLLVDEIAPRFEGGYRVIVPHWSDQERMLARYPDDVFADVKDPENALRVISGAESVITSAFHGIVFADAYGLPRRWEWFDGQQALKFADYATVLGGFEPDEWCQPPASLVSDIKEGLRGCLTSLSA